MAVEKILVVDDEPGVRSALEAILHDEGFEVESAASGEDGLRALERASFDAVLLDVWLPGIDGLATLQQLRERRVDAEVVMISGHGTIETAVRATKLGAFDFVEKPLSLEKTLLVLRNALRQRRLERMNLHLLEQLSRDTEITGQSPAAEKLRREVELAAASDAPVLIVGGPGSGREGVARRIHAAGQRADASFVEMPCGALDAEPAEKALYGAGGEPGRITLAAGGSLFLEDIERLDDALQRRLAAWAAAETRNTAGPRLLASTSPDGDGLDGELRQRLEVIRIDVPALSGRREDIPLLAERFIRELSREYGREPKRLSPDCLAALTAHDWPGNVRELQNLMERLLLFAPDEVIRATDLPEELGGQRAPLEDLYREFASLEEGVQAFERYYIRRMMAHSSDDTAAAAKRLGISATALRQKLKRGSPPGSG
jgi:two-component system nitrogen regulation response regulator NtrX